MRYGIGEAAIHQAEPRGREPRIDGDAVGAVAVEVQRAGARAVAPVDDRDRNRGAVPCGHFQAFGRIERGIVARGDLLDLEQFQGARLDVIVVDRGGADHRFVSHAQHVHVPLGIVGERGGVAGLRERDRLHTRGIVVVAHFDPVEPGAFSQRLAALDHVEIAEQIDPGEVERIGALDQGRPLAGIAERRRGKAEILMRVVSVDVEHVLTLVDIVLYPLDARFHEDLLAQRIVCGEEADLAGLMVAAADQQPFLVRGERGSDAESFVVLVVEFDVVFQRLAQPVQTGIVDPPLLGGQRVDQRLVVRHPDEAGQSAGDLIRQELAGGQILDPRREAFRAVVVHRIGQQPAVGAGGDGAQVEVFLALRQRHFVEDQFVGAAVVDRADGTAPPLLVFRALLELDPVEPVAVLLRHRLIGFLDAGPHFLEQRVDLPLAPCHPRFEPAIFRFQVLQHGLVGDLRITGIAQPCIIVGDGQAMVGEGMRLLCRLRRTGKGLRGICHRLHLGAVLPKGKYRDGRKEPWDGGPMLPLRRRTSYVAPMTPASRIPYAC